MPSYSPRRPRRRVIGSAVFSSQWAANLPRPTSTRGRIARICASRKGWQARISSGSGLRFCGGRHLMTLAMKTSLRAAASCPSR